MKPSYREVLVDLRLLILSRDIALPGYVVDVERSLISESVNHDPKCSIVTARQRLWHIKYFCQVPLRLCCVLALVAPLEVQYDSSLVSR